MRPGDARAWLDVHRAAVRGLAAGDYPDEAIRAWAPLPVTDAEVERLRGAATDERRLVAVRGGRVVGIAAWRPATSEVTACYVAPEEARSGVGSALLDAIEAGARRAGLSALEADSSLNAEPFYRRRGYAVLERGTRRLEAGPAMAAVRMRKALEPAAKRLSGCRRFD
jgi:putative acetyltransferase